MTTIERLVGNIFVGNSEPILKKFSYSEEVFKKEKNEALRKIGERKKDTESQINEQRRYINKLEVIAHKLSNQTTNIDPYNLFKNLPNMVLVFDHKFNILDYNQSFLDNFCNSELQCDSKIFSILDNLKIYNAKKETMTVYGKTIDYYSEFYCDYNNDKYKAYTTPVYDDLNKFDYFVRIYTKI